ncbi:MAG: hypothetical protein QXK06_05110 [Candidatus Diapherotrites archaeon]
MKKKFLVLVFLFFFLDCFAFTINSRVADTSQEMRRDLTEYAAGVANTSSPTTAFIKLQETAFSVNVSGLKDWHGEYTAVAFLYGPRLISKEGTITAEKPSIKLRFYWKKGSEIHELDCEPRPTLSLKTVGQEQRCDLKDGGFARDGIIVYRIDKISGPDYVEKTRIGWWVFKLYSYYSIKSGADPAVTIDYSLKFRTDTGTGSGGTFTEWVSTEAQLREISSGATTGTGQKPLIGADACKPLIGKIYYAGAETVDPKSFHLANFGDIFSVMVRAGVDCQIKDFSLGLWKTSTISGQPEIKIGFLLDEITTLNQQGSFWKNVMLNQAAYPAKMYLAARLVNAEGREFFSAPVEMTFPSVSNGTGTGTGPGTGPGTGTGTTTPPVPLKGCDPCQSVVGCIACLDSAMAGALK